jgi:hypothetical protein
MLWLIIIRGSEAFEIPIVFFKFVESIPVLIDLINLLFIYQYKIKEGNSLNRLHLSLILVFIRLIINFDVIRRKCDCRSKRQIIVIVDLLLFILVNINLLRDSSTNSIRIVRKIILGILIFQLNNLLCYETFWTTFIKSNDQQKRMIDTLDRIIDLRWILSSTIVCLYGFSTLQSIIINPNGHLFSMDEITISLNTHRYDAVICMIILYVIHWDTLHNRNTLHQKGISCLCIGFDLVPKIRKVDRPILSQTQPTITVVADKPTLQSGVLDSPITNSVAQEPVSVKEKKSSVHRRIFFHLVK